ncbi:TerL [Salmonella phage 41]|nr:TerL [Salmonella phage 41]
MKSGSNEIGYGEGIRQAEDVDFFDERPDLITNEENWAF